MVVQFDPYYKWLGIQPRHQPPSYYRLLGLEQFEPDQEVIEAAADRQLGFVQKHQLGLNAAECQNLLNEISKARLCLLSLESKREYDWRLRDELQKVRPTIEADDVQKSAHRYAWTSLAIGLIGGVASTLIAVTLFNFNQRQTDPKSDTVTANSSVAGSPEGSDSEPASTVAEEKPYSPESSVLQDTNALQIDILPLLKQEHVRRGTWTIRPDSLEATGTDLLGQIVLPVPAPEEYTIHIEATRLATPDTSPKSFSVGLVCGKQSCLFALENNSAAGNSGLELIDGKSRNENETTIQAGLMSIPTPFRLDACVRKGSIEIRLNDRTIVDWNKDFSRLQRPDIWNLAASNQLFVGTDANCRITKLTLGPALAIRKRPAQVLKVDEAVDLLPFVDLKRDVWSGDWRKAGSAIQSSFDSPYARVSIPNQLPDEYELTIYLEMLRPGHEFALGLPFQGTTANVALGAVHGDRSVLLIDRELNYDMPGFSHQGRLFKSRKSKVTAIVRKAQLVMKVDDFVVFDWKGDARRFTAHPPFATPGNQLTLITHQTEIKIDSVNVTRLRDSASFPPPPNPKDGDLIKIVDLNRDTAIGVWTREREGLQSHGSQACALRFPAKLPTNYEFRLLIERKSLRDGMCLVLPIAGQATTLTLDGLAGTASGVEGFEGRLSHENSTTVPTKTHLFPVGEARALHGTVQGKQLRCTLDGQDFLNVTIPDKLLDPPNRLRPGWFTPEESLHMYIATLQCQFLVREFNFSPLDSR